MTRSHTRADRTAAKSLSSLGVLLLAGAAAAAPPGPRQLAQLDADFRATYPMSVPATAQLAGVRLAKLGLPGLQLSTRSEHAPDDGGLVLSFADRAGAVRVLVRLVVTADAGAARRVLDAELHGVAAQLGPATDPGLGELAWADDDGRGASLVVAALGNVAYSVSVLEPGPGLPTAAALAQTVRAAMVPGAPAFPAVTVQLPPTIDAKSGAPVSLVTPAGSTYKLRADGGYIARGANGPVVRPFGPGPVAVHATVVDGLGRVTVATATTTASPQAR